MSSDDRESALIQRLLRQQAAIVGLASRQTGRLAETNLFLQEITEVAARTLGVARASIWSLDAAGEKLACVDLFELDSGTHSAGTVLAAADYPRYFAALVTGRAIDAHDAREDTRTSEFRAGYLEPLGITSMMDAALRHEGRVAGVICHEQVGPARVWSADEVAFAGALADQVALVWEAAERHRLEEERERMRHQLLHSQKLESLGTLAAGIAHDIMNPLTYVAASVEFVSRQLRRPPDPSTWASVVDAIRDAQQGLDRVRRIVGDLKRFSRAGELDRGPVDVHAVIDSSSKIAWNEIRYRARLLKDYGEVPHALASEVGLGQVVLNLLVNAAQSIGEGHVDRNEIRVTTRLDERGRVAIEVRDTGPGVPPELLGRIFDPFFTTKGAGTGTGLGLSICRDIIASLGGDISVENVAMGGALFRVTLPVAAQPAVEAEPPATSRDGRRGRVLFVDDEQNIITAVSRVLGMEHDVVGMTSARAALDHLAGEGEYDAILCDLMMPEMSGIELHDELRLVRPALAERMIFVTGGAFTPMAREFLQRVPNPRLDKPLDFVQLRSLLRDRVV